MYCVTGAFMCFVIYINHHLPFVVDLDPLQISFTQTELAPFVRHPPEVPGITSAARVHTNSLRTTDSTCHFLLGVKSDDVSRAESTKRITAAPPIASSREARHAAGPDRIPPGARRHLRIVPLTPRPSVPSLTREQGVVKGGMHPAAASRPRQTSPGYEGPPQRIVRPQPRGVQVVVSDVEGRLPVGHDQAPAGLVHLVLVLESRRGEVALRRQAGPHHVGQRIEAGE